jgi:hypothetical protein
LFGYVAEDRAASCRDLPRHQSEPGAEVYAAPLEGWHHPAKILPH